jgi:DivIVA domain-containing protein
MRRKKQEQDAPASGDRRLTPVDVQQVEFRLAFRGYSERDVDAFLDRVTEDLSSYLEENERLRAGGALPPAIPAPFGASGEAEADEIVARAREEAASIVRRAEAEADAIRAGAAIGGSGDTRAAVAPFLNREREFLQALGTLVQGHAEEIKGMVLALRARSEEPASAASGASATPSAAPSSQAPPAAPASAETGRRDLPSALFGTGGEGEEPTAASPSEIADRLGMSTVTMPDAPEDEERVEEDAPVIIDSATEPAFSSEGAPAGERRERSLRELFWGED